MNVLLVTFSFPPAGGVGVMRALSLARYLPESDIQLDALTARNAPAVVRDEKLLTQVPASVRVHRTWTLDLPFTLRKGVKKLLARKPSRPAASAASAQPGSPGKPNLLRRAVANLLLPDPQIGWLPFALPAASSIIRRHNIDAVVITVPPFSSVKLAPALRKRFPDLPIVLDFRDEWLDTTLHLVSLNANSRARRIAEQSEAEAVRAASSVVLVTEAAQRTLRARYPQEPTEKFQCVSNGFDGPLPTPSAPRSRDNNAPVTLTYLGTVYGSTEPTSFVEAVLRLPAPVRERLRVRFVGRIERPEDRAQLQRLGSVVELIPFLPQAEALRLLADTDYVLLLSHDPINVSGKLYDYLGSGKPVLAAVHPDGDVRRRLEETRAGLWADIRDPEQIAAMLTGAVERLTGTTVKAFAPDATAIARYHRRMLAQQYAALLRSLPKLERA